MATITVTNLNDSGAGSLRQALADAQSMAGEDSIVFASNLSGGTIRLSSILITNAAETTTINGDIDGDGVIDITVSGDTDNIGDGNTRLLVNYGALAIHATRLAEGYGRSTGAALTDPIANRGGTLTITESEIVGHISRVGEDALFPAATIYNTGALTIRNTLFEGNISDGLPRNRDGNPLDGQDATAGIYNAGANASLYVDNVGFSGNIGNGQRGGDVSGAGQAGAGGDGIVGVFNRAPLDGPNELATLLFGPSDARAGFGGNNDLLARGDLGQAYVGIKSLNGTNDTLAQGQSGGSGADTLAVSGSYDGVLLGFAGDDVLFGNIGADSVVGGAGGDMLFGGPEAPLAPGIYDGKDTLIGGAGDDTLQGGFDNDVIEGGLGNDLIIVRQGEFLDMTDGGPGRDRLDLSDTTDHYGPVAPDATLDGVRIIVTGDGQSQVDARGVRTTGNPVGISGVNAITNVEEFILSQAADVADVDGDNFFVDGQGGDDTITGRSGDDTLNGGADNDSLVGAGGSDTLFGGSGDDVLRAGSGAFDILNGGIGNDTLSADGSSNSFFDGGEDDDLIQLDSGGNHSVDGGTGADRLQFFSNVDAFQFAGLAGADAIVVTPSDPAAGLASATVMNVETFIFSDRTLSEAQIRDIIDPPPPVSGPTEGPDLLVGTGAADVIRALGGDDTVTGLGGDDLIFGGGGDENIRGSGGNDSLRGNGGDDTIRGNGGEDNINGGGGLDSLLGGGGGDSIKGGGGGDTIKGGGGSDVINGGGGADLLQGGGGADTITGRGGDDTMRGNGGADVFQLRASDRNDVILDFQQGQDQIEIISGARTFAALQFTQDGADVLIGFGPGQVRVVTDRVAAFDEDDFIF